ncbi:MAG: GGDEF domain-containing protein [Dehalococcoidia bacterium]
MNARRWRALAVALTASVAVALGIAAVFANVHLAGAVLSLAVLLLALLLYREIERVAGLRARTARMERLLAQTETSLERAESTDPLTHLANRRAFFERLQEDFRRSSRYGRPLTCMMLDLDRFAWINERYGEHFGDEVLTQFADILTRDLRETDLAVRYEGETFAILLPETGAKEAVAAADRMRGTLKGHVFTNGVVACAATASFGVAGLPDARIARLDDLVHRAVQALGQAKQRGRDRVVLDAPSEREASLQPPAQEAALQPAPHEPINQTP